MTTDSEKILNLIEKGILEKDANSIQLIKLAKEKKIISPLLLESYFISCLHSHLLHLTITNHNIFLNDKKKVKKHVEDFLDIHKKNNFDNVYLEINPGDNNTLSTNLNYLLILIFEQEILLKDKIICDLENMLTTNSYEDVLENHKKLKHLLLKKKLEQKKLPSYAQIKI